MGIGLKTLHVLTTKSQCYRDESRGTRNITIPATGPMTGGCQHLENLVSVAIGKGQSWLRNVCTTLHVHVDQNGKLA